MQQVIQRIMRGFNPLDYGLAEDFLLTKLTQMKGCGCKVPRTVLLDLLEILKDENSQNGCGGLGIGLDCCVVPLRYEGLYLVQTTDFFYPLVDDPYLMGRITCANVLSDLYAMGVFNCDNMLILLGVSREMEEKERNVIVSLFFSGFKDAACEAGTSIRGGQTVHCPWLLLGGVATSVCTTSDMAKIENATVGDVIIITKPIGGQVAVNAYEWLKKKTGRIEELKLDVGKIIRAYQQTVEQMCRLNINAAKLAIKYGTHATTDVTGFGILGHADNLAKAQKSNVRFIIHTLPIIEYMDEVSRKMDKGFNLFGGTSAETSGGLLIAIPREDAEKFCSELKELDGHPAWIIGDVVSGNRGAVIVENPNVLCISSSIHNN